MFFGAGNLILPPFIGINSTSGWIYALIGFSLTAVIAPFISLIAVGQVGNNFMDMGKRVNPKLIMILAFITICLIGPVIGIPRTGATTFEIGLRPIFPNISPNMAALAFFTLNASLSISPHKIIDIIGKYLTPILIILLLTLILIGIIFPSHVQHLPEVNTINLFALGFHEGYQTMDILSAVIFAGIILKTMSEQGELAPKQRLYTTIKAGLIAALALFFIYAGLIYLGAISDYPLADHISRTTLLLYISTSILGPIGTYLIALTMTLACLTTAIALTSAFASFMEKITKGKIGYKLNVILCSLLSAILSVKGVDEIISYAEILLGLIYPIVFALVIYLVFLGKFVKAKAPYIAAVIVTSLVSSLSAFLYYFPHMPILGAIRNKLPFAEHNMDWLLPSFIAFIISSLFSKNKDFLDSRPF
ncbi:branched-chain amino acid transport system II carrier protein [Elizabethkingia argentiflava]|uniref:Branched-chain amino acid transport system II carrier protein n=2 Tax=Elizabethkingia argenteiflava TaxID=2681556 RepID=A0A845PXZ4_9FLAO|nr:branched-chain amino acid transport system II carrier protein [Elizabethkingia argenteiflava]